jgi:hypothetical protein
VQKLSSFKEFQAGRIYNRVYTGSNDAYGRVNGKETFIVIQTEPILQTQTLFDQYGSVTTDDLRQNGPTTFQRPDIAFTEYDLFEPSDKSEWFIKSVRVGSLREALDANLLDRSAFENKQFRGDRYVSHSGRNFEHLGFSMHFSVEGGPNNPYLQTVYVLWKTYNLMKEDLARFGATLQ